MKKIATIIVTLCLFVGMFGNVNYSVYAKEIPENYIVETEPYSQEQKEQLKNTNYIFSQEELKNTPYEGQEVEIIEGELYVNGRIIWTIKIWILSKGIPTLIGWMAAGGVVKSATNKTINAELIQQVRLAEQRFSNLTDAYADEQQNLQSIKLSNGNQCVLAPSGKYFNCMYSS